MRCIHCGRDSKYRDRQRGGSSGILRSGFGCPVCGHDFAFEPKHGALMTDAGFKAAIDAVSASGRLRWGVEHLYYEVCRRRRRLPYRYLVGAAVATVAAAFVTMDLGGGWWAAPAAAATVFAAMAVARAVPAPTVRVPLETFNRMWEQWLAVHGSPEGVIVRPKREARRRAAEPDLGDYSFDRAVICDRARTVDLLLANNFHFENNCAVLAVHGYPAGPFETVRAMLKRNPRLQVFALHDASPEGCRLAHTLAHDPGWFAGDVSVTDVGLRPGHSKPFRGLFLRAQAQAPPGNGLGTQEAGWLSRYTLELAAIRPEQVLKRLYRAINKKFDPDEGEGPYEEGDDDVEYDSDSFGTDAGDGDGGADGFG